MVRRALLVLMSVGCGALVSQPAAHAGEKSGSLVPYEVRGDRVSAPLAGLTGDPARGRSIVIDRRVGNCLICHSIGSVAEPFQGVIGPTLGGVGSRLEPGQIRLRLIDQSRLNPATIMPPYYRTHDLNDVAEAFRGRPALTAQQIEDVVAYLATLKE